MSGTRLAILLGRTRNAKQGQRMKLEAGREMLRRLHKTAEADRTNINPVRTEQATAQEREAALAAAQAQYDAALEQFRQSVEPAARRFVSDQSLEPEGDLEDLDALTRQFLDQELPGPGSGNEELHQRLAALISAQERLEGLQAAGGGSGAAGSDLIVPKGWQPYQPTAGSAPQHPAGAGRGNRSCAPRAPRGPCSGRLRKELDERLKPLQAPDGSYPYEVGDRIWSTFSQQIDALKDGRRFIDANFVISRADFEKLEPAAQEAFRLGMAARLADKSESLSGVTQLIRRDGTLRRRMEPVFGDDQEGLWSNFWRPPRICGG